MRIATFNIENLFTRARALNLETWAEGRPILERYAELNQLFEEAVYTDAVKSRMLKLMAELGIEKTNDGRFVTLRENRGKFSTYSRINGTRIVAQGRADWIGWVELKTEIINETATRNTAQVVRDVAPDVLGVVECEGRTALRQFSDHLLPTVGAEPFAQAMLIDGNDERGIDVGLLTRKSYEIGWMKSHVDDRTTTGERVFSRDCPEYAVWTPSGATVWVLVNHFKSKGYGNQDSSDRKRWMQSEAVRQITERLKLEGAEMIAVVGDLNDTPGSGPLAPLLGEAGFKDISEHPAYRSDGRPGTYQRGGEREKIDYVLLSPRLFERVSGGGIWRRGVWGPNKTPQWEVYPEMTSSYHAASDHACLWADLAL
jgi:endonuclease/exonuclease/phosphatase family metal-dependent hydrolase